MNAGQARAEQLAHLNHMADSTDAVTARRARLVIGASLPFQDAVNAEILRNGGKDEEYLFADVVCNIAVQIGFITDHLVVRGLAAEKALDTIMRHVAYHSSQHAARKQAEGYVPEPIDTPGRSFDFRTMMRHG